MDVDKRCIHTTDAIEALVIPLRKEVIPCPTKMEPDPATPGVVNGRVGVLPVRTANRPNRKVREANAPVAVPARVKAGVVERESKADVAAVGVRAAQPTGLPRLANPTARVPDGASQSTRKGVTTMPGLDGTGPEFAGPMTGAGRGWCAGDAGTPGIGYGSGFGCGRGRGNRQGRGGRPYSNLGYGQFGCRFRAMSPSVVDSETRLEQAEQQAAMMQAHLDAIHARIESLKAKQSE